MAVKPNLIKPHVYFDEYFNITPTSKKLNKTLEKVINNYFENNRRKRNLDSSDRFNVFLIFYFKKNPYRIDVDNLAKPVLDYFSGKLYKDDSQIFKLSSEKRYNQLNNGFSIRIIKLKE